MTEETDNVVRLVVHNRVEDAPTGYKYKRCEAALPVVPAEPGWSLLTYYADQDTFGHSPIVAWRIGPERAHPVTYHCQIEGAPTAVVSGPHEKVIGCSGAGRWPKDVQDWKEAVRERASEAKASR